jgi:hypothetical protein
VLWEAYIAGSRPHEADAAGQRHTRWSSDRGAAATMGRAATTSGAMEHVVLVVENGFLDFDEISTRARWSTRRARTIRSVRTCSTAAPWRASSALRGGAGKGRHHLAVAPHL